MVRVNLINPRNLSDQHLIAEYNEILMLVGHLRKHGHDESKIPKEYVLGPGHINFFKNKLLYLKKRHEDIKAEMAARSFKTDVDLEINEFDDDLKRNWKPKDHDIKLIKQRLSHKIRLKPEYYRYYGEYKGQNFLLSMVKNA